MATAPECLGRKRPVPSCPNPLFVKWLTELRDTAREKGLKTQFVYQKALQSLQKYPLPLKTGREAKILQNFGDGICRMLDERLQEHLRGEEQQRRGEEEPGEALQSGTSSSSSLCSDGPSQQNSGHAPQPGRGGRRREYVPQKRSGGYAVLLTLHTHTQRPGSKGFMFRNELQTEAQALCDKSFTVPDLGSRYTAWSSVSTLVQKELLLKTHNPARYSLTERGRVLAQKLLSEESSQAEERSDRVVDLTLHEEEEEEDRGGGLITSDTQPGPASRWSLPHGSYTILLCVDIIETTGGSSARKQELVKELQRNGVTFDIRKLNVGDFLWIARENVAPVPGQLRPPPPKELVLDHIVERKRMDDLCGSIIDGRFREQKFRLKRCGLRRPVYLVEECGSAASHLSLPEATLQQAIVNTQVVDGFFVKRVQDMRESAAYLTIMTRQLQKLYQGCTLFCRSRELEGDEEEERKDHTHVSCSLITFSEFNHGAIKNKCQTVREVFARQLMQISGLSGDKAAAVLQHYSTVSSLLTAYDHCGSDTEREKLLATIRYGKLQRNLGPSLSRSVYQLYCSPAALT